MSTQLSAGGSSASKHELREKKVIRFLCWIFVAQVALFALLLFNENLSASENEPRQILSFDTKKVTKILIEQRVDGQSPEKGREKLVLEMNAKSDWLLPDYWNFPADSDRVHKMLDQLHGLKGDYLLGTTDDASERHKVGVDNFNRAITLFQGEKQVGQFFLGENLSADSVACRVNKDAATFSVELPLSHFPSDAKDWIDRRATTIKLKAVAAIDLGAYKLVNYEEKWNLVEGNRTDLLNADAVKGVIYPAANCRITSVLGFKPSPDYDLAHPVLTYKILLKDKTERTYKVSKSKKSGEYIGSIANFPWFCVLDQRTIDKLRTTTAEDLRQNEKLAHNKRPDLKTMLRNTMERVSQSVAKRKSDRN